MQQKSNAHWLQMSCKFTFWHKAVQIHFKQWKPPAPWNNPEKTPLNNTENAHSAWWPQSSSNRELTYKMHQKAAFHFAVSYCYGHVPTVRRYPPPWHGTAGSDPTRTRCAVPRNGHLGVHIITLSSETGDRPTSSHHVSTVQWQGLLLCRYISYANQFCSKVGN